jgi:hypothetical protein
MESTKFYVRLNVTILKCENITMEEEDLGGRPSRNQDGYPKPMLLYKGKGLMVGVTIGWMGPWRLRVIRR